MGKITPFLWFNDNGQDAANFYVSIFKNSKVTYINQLPDGKVTMGSFTLEGQDYIFLNGGPQFKFNESISMFVNCEGQAEVDEYWNKLIADGGEEGNCGWLKDKFGVSWQIIPTALGQLMGDPKKGGAVMQAMLKMHKIVVADLQKAFDAA